MKPDRKPVLDEATDWTLCGLWLLFIYVTIPLARDIQEYIRDHGGKILFLWVTFACFALAAACVASAVVRKKLVVSMSGAATLVAVLAVFSSFAWSLRANPEEAMHFVEYGVLSFLLYRALCHRITDYSVFLVAAMLGSFFGIVDELIQWIVPRRFFDFRDIGINVTAVVLMQTAIAAGIRPSCLKRRMGCVGVRYGLAVLLANLTLMLFCVSNTPTFRLYYGKYFPAAAETSDMTIEYGFLYRDPVVGEFKSRLSPAELARQDRELYQEILPKLNAYRTDRQYNYFISKAKAYRDPLLVEARVHIFRRDRYAQLSRKSESADERRESAYIAHGENTILEAYFPNVIRNSRYAWPDDVKAAFAARSRNAPPYISPVSSSLVTSVSQRTLVACIGIAMAICVAGLAATFRRSA